MNDTTLDEERQAARRDPQGGHFSIAGRLSVATALIVLVVCPPGCSKKSKTEGGAEIEETGQELSANPVEAMQQLGEVGKRMADHAQSLKDRPPVDPVKFDVLIAFLPQAEGWTASDPKGATTQMVQWKISNASRSYTKADGSRIKVELVDGSYVPMVYAPFTAMVNFAQETTEGYTKGIKIDGQPAFEEWKKSGGRAKLNVLVADRFLLKIDGTKVTPELVREWAGKIDLEKLAALAKG